MTWPMMCFRSAIIRPRASPSRPMSSSPATSTATVRFPSEAALATFMSWRDLGLQVLLGLVEPRLLVNPLERRGDQPADVAQGVEPALRRRDPLAR